MKRTIHALFISTVDHVDNQYSNALAIIHRFGIQLETVRIGRNIKSGRMQQVPHVIIIDARDKDQLRLMANHAHNLRRHEAIRQLPILLYGPTKTFTAFNVDGHLDDRLPATGLSTRIKRFIRLQALKNEYALRMRTLATFGIKPTPAIPNSKTGKLRLLFVGKGERYFQLARLFDGRAQLKQTNSLKELDKMICEQSYDCIFIDSLTTPELTLPAFPNFKYRANSFNIPIVVFQEGLDSETQRDFLHYGECELFEFPPERDQTVNYFYTIINAENLRLHLANAFKHSSFLPVIDDYTGLPSRSFFERHLELLTQQSNEWNRPLAFGIIQIYANLPCWGPSVIDTKRKLMRQVAKAINSITRAEDLITYLDNGRFAVTTPNSSSLSIAILMARVEAVIQMTGFFVNNENCTIDTKCSYFDKNPHDTPREIMKCLSA